ncbi:uncharacterized protein LOC120724504 isoform X1 [Simochromis diagramma]|uniref:uncharacterized protein LOC120724504 isoform X1 n=3 Tax=Simochromis diagramma TaxID=43689 RepID=UPI001A7E86FF|nr:uncharacterized protein LOC120724504 isoform X1 [Simochromis diagramma]
MPRLCAFCGCNNRVGCGLSFFAFPKDSTRRRKWLLNLMRADLSPDMTREESDRAGYVVCEQHFRPKDINSKGRRKRLAPEAVPILLHTIKEEQRDLEMPSTDVHAPVPLQDTPPYEQVVAMFNKLLAEKDEKIKDLKSILQRERARMRLMKFRMNSKIRELKRKLEQQQNSSGDQGDQLTAASDCLPQAAKEFFDKQIAMAKVRKHGQRYDKKQKDMAIQLYKQSPSCYSELQKMFQLPSSTTLRRHQVVSQEASPSEEEDREPLGWPASQKDTPGDPERGEEEKLADVAGWVVQKVAQDPEVSACTECESLLVETNDTEHNYHTRMEKDAVSAVKKSPTSARLLHPSEAFKECISKCDSVIQKIPPNAMAPKKLKAYLRASGAFSELHRIHPAHSKAIERVAVNKYVMCRVVAELKETAQNRKRTHEKKSAACQELNVSTLEVNQD